jgi:hypothetical protein
LRKGEAMAGKKKPTKKKKKKKNGTDRPGKGG